jgi:hypothetical protein
MAFFDGTMHSHPFNCMDFVLIWLPNCGQMSTSALLCLVLLLCWQVENLSPFPFFETGEPMIAPEAEANNKKQRLDIEGGVASPEGDASLLASLPHEVLLHVLHLAARPLSAWREPVTTTARGGQQ